MKTELHQLAVAFLLILSAPVTRAAIPESLKRDFETLRWITYSPTGADPTSAKSASEADIKADLEKLKLFGFEGIVTYGCAGTLGAVPRLAGQVGIKHVILGVWNPQDADDLKTAKSLSSQVDGYCVGNEGISPGTQRYSLSELKSVIEELKASTKKPVATSEEVDDYLQNHDLIEVGDWVFPNAHPYWANQLTEIAAIEWTKAKYTALTAVAGDKFIVIKETGFPTAGDPKVSEQLQAQYYAALSKAKVPFVYFEAYDQPWKKHREVEPHWGLFRTDRSPKVVTQLLFGLGAAQSSSCNLVFLSPLTKSNVTCGLTGDGGQIAVKGTSKGIYGTGKKLVLFLNPQHPAARGWYVQFGVNGIDDFRSDGSWKGVAQMGNHTSPPKGGEEISIAVVALPVAEADAVFAKAKQAPELPLGTLPEAGEGLIGHADDVIVRLK